VRRVIREAPWTGLHVREAEAETERLRVKGSDVCGSERATSWAGASESV
jgi:hypothetical protein